MNSIENVRTCHLPSLQNQDPHGDLVLPDVSYQVESSEGDQTQNMDPQGQTLLLFLFVDFHSGFPVQEMELWVSISVLLLSVLLRVFSECIYVNKSKCPLYVMISAHQKLQASLSVAVNSIMSIMTGSTSSSFRKTCLQTLQVSRRLGMLKSARVLMTFYYLSE
eukprot:bmy_07816T0